MIEWDIEANSPAMASSARSGFLRWRSESYWEANRRASVRSVVTNRLIFERRSSAVGCRRREFEGSDEPVATQSLSTGRRADERAGYGGLS